MRHIPSIPYEQRTDLEKIQSQWTKLSGLHDRTDWSAAVVRAATAIELTLNLAIRREYADRGETNQAAIDKKLKLANGAKNKLERLLFPLLRGKPKFEVAKSLKKHAKHINMKRNDIVHRGVFCSEDEATVLIQKCKAFVEGLAGLYEPGFTLVEHCNRE